MIYIQLFSVLGAVNSLLRGIWPTVCAYKSFTYASFVIHMYRRLHLFM